MKERPAAIPNRGCSWFGVQVAVATALDIMKIVGALLAGSSSVTEPSLWLHLALLGVAAGRIVLHPVGAEWHRLRIALMIIFWAGLVYDLGTVIAWVIAVEQSWRRYTGPLS